MSKMRAEDYQHPSKRVQNWVRFCIEKHEKSENPLTNWPESMVDLSAPIYLDRNANITLRQVEKRYAMIFGNIGLIYETDFWLTLTQIAYGKLTNWENWEVLVPEVEK